MVSDLSNYQFKPSVQDSNCNTITAGSDWTELLFISCSEECVCSGRRFQKSQMWVSEGRPSLDPRLVEGVNPLAFPSVKFFLRAAWAFRNGFSGIFPLQISLKAMKSTDCGQNNSHSLSEQIKRLFNSLQMNFLSSKIQDFIITLKCFCIFIFFKQLQKEPFKPRPVFDLSFKINGFILVTKQKRKVFIIVFNLLDFYVYDSVVCFNTIVIGS